LLKGEELFIAASEDLPSGPSVVGDVAAESRDGVK
jgi:hypothetical protein